MSKLELEEESSTDGNHEHSVRRLVENAARFLPTQGPIEVFVLLNNLQAFEDQPFHQALKAARECYQAEPYLSEQEYRRLYAKGRITDEDLEAVVMADLGQRGLKVINGLGMIAELRFAMLRHPIHVGPDAELRWVVAETDALERFRDQTTRINRTRIITSTRKWLNGSGNRDDIPELASLFEKFGHDSSRWSDVGWEAFSLQLLWRICLKGVACSHKPAEANSFVRPRDLMLHATGDDINRNVHDVLIRFCAAYVDQGYSDWTLPNRDAGFYESFLALYETKTAGLNSWLSGLACDVRRLKQEHISAEQCIEHTLTEFGIAPANREAFITQSLLSLAGWAGMVWQLELGVDWVVHNVPKESLIGMLAVQLLLERHAIRHIGREAFGESDSIPQILALARQKVSQPEPMKRERRAFLLFQVAQMLGWTPLELLQLTDDEWQEISDELESFPSLERRRIFHEAFERKYVHATLDAFATHTARRRNVASPWLNRPDFQIVTCIDDREESFRRHLEEVLPTCETFGAAGFFAVAMNYRGAADAFYKPLCPAVIKPVHYVQEDVGYTFEGEHQSRAQIRRQIGLFSHAFHKRSRTFLGGILTGVLGTLASVPLVARVLFPHLTARIRQRFGSLLQPPPVTNLQLERYEGDPGPTNGHIGYSVDEMAGVVVRLLRDMGVTKSEHFSRLFVICGHGSSSLNNPHESSYCCGACAGKRGGPNARAFAQMANDWRVRTKVAAQGVDIPDDTFFVGSYHNTCDDSVVFYDLDRLPASHREDLEVARKAIEEARRRNAHERCRRFGTVPLSISAKDALRHVEARAEDISQPRPEYDHATNSLCIVGRRQWSRGLFLDRRAFLTSYDPEADNDEHSVLLGILSAAVPVCSGINLSFYFSTVDNVHYGSGSKLPHNVASLVGVMEGTSSDLRTGVYQQVCEIHEPMRLTFVIETTPEVMLSIMERNAVINRLIRGAWVHLAVIDPATSEIQMFKNGEFQVYQPSGAKLNEVESSLECYEGSRDHLPFFSIHETEVA
ncbi:MAG: DUF2309 domain-containing protein [Planctomycetaceae bacterium]|nr:DUF2309 domain-containing protein [Planctomycetaceae bacterium]MCB9953715.1 DUF2309 domain-containing protein [Planctomycetaceae bacterium]